MKTIMITGASSGIGRETAILLSKLGYKIIAIGRNLSRLNSLKNEYDNIDTISADIATESGRSDVISQVMNKRIDILINNAGLMSPSGDLVNIDVKSWRYQISVNVEAPLFLTTGLIKNLKFGRVLNITIYSSFRVTSGLAAYGISKSALNMLTHYMKSEFEKLSVSVGLALPGVVDTDIQNQLPKDFGKGYNKNKRNLLSPSLVANFLAWVVLDTTQEQFSGNTFDIYDEWHQSKWNSGEKIDKDTVVK